MNRKQLRDALTARLGIPPSGDGLLTETALVDCIQLALTDMSVEHHWPWLLASSAVTFTAGAAPFPTSPAVLNARELVVDGDRAQRAGSLSEFLDAQTLGDPCLWFEQENEVVLAPTPVTQPTTATLYYTRTEPDLVSEAQSPLLPVQHHNVLLAGAAYHAEMRRSQMERAAQYLGEYQAGIKKMKGSYPSRTGPRTVRLAGTVQWARWS